MSNEKDITNLSASIECYESCVEQLKRELPKYFQSQQHVTKDSNTSNSFAKVLRAVGSLESNENIQSALFLFALKTENLEKERKIYEKCQSSVMTLLDVAKTKIVAPAKVSHSYFIVHYINVRMVFGSDIEVILFS